MQKILCAKKFSFFFFTSHIAGPVKVHAVFMSWKSCFKKKLKETFQFLNRSLVEKRHG